MLEQLADGRRVHGLVQGRATRLLHDAGRWSPAGVEARLGRALTPGTPAADGAAFVEGFLAGSGTVLLHDDQLLAIVDAWIASLRAGRVRRRRRPAAPHVRRLRAGRAPAARRAARPPARSSASAPMGDDVDEARGRAGLATVRAMLGLRRRRSREPTP